LGGERVVGDENKSQVGFVAELDIKVTRADGSVEVYEDVGGKSLVEEQKHALLKLPSFREWLEKKAAAIENEKDGD
jgi:hypothetical protein